MHALDSQKYLISLRHSREKLQIKLFSINIQISLIKTLNNRGPKIDP